MGIIGMSSTLCLARVKEFTQRKLSVTRFVVAGNKCHLIVPGAYRTWTRLGGRKRWNLSPILRALNARRRLD